MTGQPSSPQTQAFGYGFSWRKRWLVRRFCGFDKVRFVQDARRVPIGATLLLWGSTPAPPGLGQGVAVVRLEDGFLRSVGLGADLTLPLSWVMDGVGIYYDATRPSALETLLQEGACTDALLRRARNFRERVVAEGLTKYNLGALPWRRPDKECRVVLVPGQVESDASIAFGAVDIRTNLDLLRAVRQSRPQAWLIYKPHPDVVAGLRDRGRGEEQAAAYCDEVVQDVSMHELLGAVDEVHVMTSLTGFEALLRGKPVVCWGLPFYAGWGLTEDRHGLSRRSRRLTLDELVAAALLLYPVYLSRVTRRRCTPEQALDELLAWRQSRAPRDRWWRKWVRPLLARP